METTELIDSLQFRSRVDLYRDLDELERLIEEADYHDSRLANLTFYNTMRSNSECLIQVLTLKLLLPEIKKLRDGVKSEIVKGEES